jgi:hypothetical protein
MIFASQDFKKLAVDAVHEPVGIGDFAGPVAGQFVLKRRVS